MCPGQRHRDKITALSFDPETGRAKEAVVRGSGWVSGNSAAQESLQMNDFCRYFVQLFGSGPRRCPFRDNGSGDMTAQGRRLQRGEHEQHS